MKKIYFLFLLCSTISFAQTVTITKVVETQCASQARLVELYVDGTLDLANFDIEIVNGNIDAWNNVALGDINGVVLSDQFFYFIRNTGTDDIAAEFPSTTFDYDPQSSGFNAIAVAASSNGDKAFRTSVNGTIIDQFGFGIEDGNDGIGTDWDHRDQVVVRLNGSPNNGTFDLNDYVFTGFNSTDSETKCDGGAGGGIEAYLAGLAAATPSIPYALGSFSPTLSNKEFSNSELSIYPNPVDNGIININSTITGTKKIELIDVTGRSIYNTKLNSNVLDVSLVKTGLYFLKVSISDRSSTSKLMIK